MNIFEKASRFKLRFHSVRGELLCEQLWDMPLTSTDGFNLDDMARSIHSLIEENNDGSFVKRKAKPDPAVASLKLQLEILVHIIEAKEEALEKRDQDLIKANRKKKLLDALASKEKEEITNKSKEELLKELEELS